MSTATPTGKDPLRFLIDSNFFIALEPYGGTLEPGQARAAEVIRLAAEQGHKVSVHPATRDDLLQVRDPTKRTQRLAELQKFPLLQEGVIPKALTDELGSPAEGSNDHRDLRILASLHQNSVAYLITDDSGLRKRAGRVALAERVLTSADASELLRQLAPSVPTPPPRVVRVATYALDADQTIFETLRSDYDGFDIWLNEKVRPDDENRDCLVIEEDGAYAGLAIVKRVEADCTYPFPKPVTKVATLKVDDDFLGRKYGELLLKALFKDAHTRTSSSIYVEVFPKHEGLIELLALFGFEDSGRRTSRGELVLMKVLVPSEGESLDPLLHHVRFGPPALSGAGSVFLVPIQPVWQDQLFPDAPGGTQDRDEQLELVPDPRKVTHPWGNALRKAYLCNAPTNQVAAGDTLLFYASGGGGEILTVGVVEDVLRSCDPVEIMALVGQRTVYPPSEITQMCSRVRGVLAILFRQDRFIDPPLTLDELMANKVVKAWPQSIVKLAAGGASWVHVRLAE